MAAKPETIDEYLAACPPEARAYLEQIREIIRERAPGATERISYAIPAFRLGETWLFYFAGWKRHVSMYPVTAAIQAELGERIEAHRKGPGTLQFPLNRPLPVDLITDLVDCRVREIGATAAA